MPIYPPKLHINKSTKRLLRVIEDLIIQSAPGQIENSNAPTNKAIADHQESVELAALLKQFIESREFFEASYFVDEISEQRPSSEPDLRETFLRNRQRRGRSRSMASMHWAAFEARLGVRSNKEERWGIGTNPMSFSHFMDMESRLFAKLRFRPEVQEYLLRLAREREESIGDLRGERLTIPSRPIRTFFNGMIENLQNVAHAKRLQLILEKKDLGAAATVVSNMSVLFTTRDWSVTGTLSCFSGALTGLLAPRLY